MDTAQFLGQLAADGALLAAAATGADLDRAVPAVDLSVRDVVAHTGAVHLWCADLVRRGLQSNETGGSAAFHPPDRADDALLDWYGAGVTALVATLRAAPDDLQVWAFGRSAPARSFWSRRQAHETAVHRADVEAGAGAPVTGFDAAFAQDGLHELLGTFARGRQFATAEAGRLALLASDGDDWLVTFGGERIVAAPSTDVAGADATVSGSSSDLYRWAWNRPSPAVVDGDDAVAALWRRVRIT